MSNVEHHNQREALPNRLAKEVQHQIQSLSRVDLHSYTYEQNKSSFKDAKSDLAIYDASGTLVLRGRDFHDRTFFWTPGYVDPRLTAS
jgi:hypothetical protein